MKKWIVFILLALSVGLTSCKSQEEEKKDTNNIQEEENNTTNDMQEDVEWSWGRKSAFAEGEDGWFYAFSYAYNKADRDNGLIPYWFYGVNLKYRYHDASGARIQIMGEYGSNALKNDRKEIDSVFGYSDDEFTSEVTPEDLLSLTVDDLNFEEFDEELFIHLIQEALTGEPHKEGKYGYLPTYALLEEKSYKDNYKCQVGFINTQGCMDVVVIDILYKTGDEESDYIQLSDMVASGAATQEQIEMYEFIEQIADGIVENNSFLYRGDASQEFAEGEISRLYTFWEEIEKGDYPKYSINS